MGKIQQIRDRLAAANAQVVEERLLEIVRKADAEFIKLNQKQLFAGVDSNDKLLRPPYRSDSYARYKLTLNPAGVVDLKLTGDFWKGFFLSAQNFPVFLGGAEEKTRDLMNKYGEDIFGLDKKNLGLVSKETIRPKLAEYYRGLIHV